MQKTESAFVIALALLALAPQAWSSPQAETNGAVTYVSGGIGDEEEGAMQDIAKDYNLRMQFALKKSGSYLADVRVNIADKKGMTLVETVAKGPCLFAKLPKGAYTVTADSKGTTQKRTISVDKGPANLRLYWSNEPDEAPAEASKEVKAEHQHHGCWK